MLIWCVFRFIIDNQRMQWNSAEKHVHTPLNLMWWRNCPHTVFLTFFVFHVQLCFVYIFSSWAWSFMTGLKIKHLYLTLVTWLSVSAGVIKNGGVKPNIIPSYTELEFYLRAPSMKDLSVLTEKVENCFKSAALATGCKVRMCSWSCVCITVEIR